MPRVIEIQYEASDLLFYAQENNLATWDLVEQALSDERFYDDMYQDKVYVDYAKVIKMSEGLYRTIVLGFFDQEGIDTGIYFLRD